MSAKGPERKVKGNEQVETDAIFQKLEHVVYTEFYGLESKEKEKIFIPSDYLEEITEHPDYLKLYGNKSTKEIAPTIEPDEKSLDKKSLSSAPGKR